LVVVDRDSHVPGRSLWRTIKTKSNDKHHFSFKNSHKDPFISTSAYCNQGVAENFGSNRIANVNRNRIFRKDKILNEPIISVSGLRGIIGHTLTPEIAVRYTAAYATTLPAGQIVVTRDGRTTGRMLADTIVNCLVGLGRDVLDGDIAATPTTGVLVRHHQCAGGIQITASHNPPEYNGMKLFGNDGRILSASLGEKVSEIYRHADPPSTQPDSLGHARRLDNTTDQHLQLVLDTINAEQIRDCHFHVLLDSNHGSGGLLGRRLLDELGCQVELVGSEPTGLFAHLPEPTETNLSSTAQRVAETEVDIGFCQDPDADRLAVIDEQGRYIGEEYTLVLCLDHVLRKHPGNVVTNCSTSRMSQDLAEKYGCQMIRTAVGEANVTDGMIQRQAVFGGEGSGGPIDPRVGYVRDSFVGMALILDAMADRQQSISRIVKELPGYAIFKTKVELDREQIDKALTALANHFADAQISRLDGLRMDWPDKWLLVRASNTEPIVRLIAEAPADIEAKQLCEQASKIIALTTN